MKIVKCPVCDSSNSQEEIKIRVMGKSVFYLLCNSCHLIFSSNKVRVSYGEKYYKRLKKGVMKYFEELYVFASNTLKRHIVDSSIDKNEVRILDVGSGNGSFLKTLGNKYIKEGLEPEKLKSIKIPSDIKMHYSTIEKFKVAQKYDLITLWHVIEHLEKPNLCLKSIRNLLNKDGILIISTPNVDSLGYKIAKDKWFHFDFPYHRNLFNKKSLNVLASMNGFNVKNFPRHDFEFPLDLLWSIIRSRKGFRYLPIYPRAKIISSETIVCVMQKND